MRRRHIILITAVILYAAMLAATWVVSTRRAWQQTKSMLDYAILDLTATVEGSIDTLLMHVAEMVIDELKEPKPLSTSEIVAIADRMDIDELNVVDRTGRILASSDARLIGKSMKDNPKPAEFMVLCDGKRHVLSQPFRAGASNPDARRKYVGIAFQGGNGFVQVGIDESHLTQMFPSIMDFIFDEWLLGEKGFFLCASTKDGRLISNPARHRDEALFIAETGYAPDSASVIEDGKTTFRQRLFGDTCDCRTIIFAGHRIVAALPLAEYYTTRTIYTYIMALVLAIVLASFVMLLWRIDKDSAKLKAFYKSEEEKRTAELEIGRTIQMAALPPDFPSNEYYKLSAFMRPAREVGGDFYDFFQPDDMHIAFLVADVSGKGITGALYMMTAKTIVKDTLLASPDLHPADVLTHVNQELCRNNPAEMFLTVWIGILALDSGRLTFANAGHNPPLLRRASGEAEWLKARSGCPLACFDNIKYKPLEISLAPGDLLFLYTDGVTEAMDNSCALFGNDRLLNAVTSAKTTDPDALCTMVRNDVDQFAGGAAQADDITLLSLQYVAVPERYIRTFPSDLKSLPTATAFLEEHLDAAKCPTAEKAQLLVALDEVLSNIVRCSGASGIAIELRISHKPMGVTMAISDDGKPFDPLQNPPPDTALPLEKREPGGLGILLLQQTMDSVSYRFAHGCNILTLRKDYK